MIFNKENCEKKLASLEKKLPGLVKNAHSLPNLMEVEVDGAKKIINPRMVALKSSRKVRKRINHIKALLKTNAS